MGMADSRMPGRGDEIQERVDAVVLEARVTLDAGLLRQDVVVLAFDVVRDFLETRRQK